MATPDSTSNTPGTNAPQNGSGTAALVLGILLLLERTALLAKQQRDARLIKASG